MSAPSASNPVARARVAVGEGGRFEGVLAFRGAARVDGSLSGSVVAEGRLEIGQTAEVWGRVEVDDLVIAGVLRGDAEARRRIELRPGARVTGDLRAPTLVIADGSRVEGRLDTTSVGP